MKANSMSSGFYQNLELYILLKQLKINNKSSLNYILKTLSNRILITVIFPKFTKILLI